MKNLNQQLLLTLMITAIFIFCPTHSLSHYIMVLLAIGIFLYLRTIPQSHPIYGEKLNKEHPRRQKLLNSMFIIGQCIILLLYVLAIQHLNTGIQFTYIILTFVQLYTICIIKSSVHIYTKGIISRRKFYAYDKLCEGRIVKDYKGNYELMFKDLSHKITLSNDELLTVKDYIEWV